MTVGEYVDTYPPDIDGVGMVCKSYTEGLNAQGETAYYVAPRGKEPYPGNFPLLTFPAIPIPNEPYTMGLPHLGMAYYNDVKKIGFDLVHAHSPFGAGMRALQVAKRLDIPLVASFHSKYYDDFLIKFKSRLIASEVVRLIVRFLEKCDEVWTVNNATADVLQGYGFRGPIVVMRNGTNLWSPTDADREAARSRWGLGDGEVFLYVGQQAIKKNIPLILEALALYASSNPNFKAVFVGQGPDENALQEQARGLGLAERTVFTGHISDRREMMRLYAAASLFLFPSLYDTSGLVVREAAAAGTPSILVRGSTASEGISDGYNGFLCEDDAGDLARKIAASIGSSAAVGANARKTLPIPWTQIIEQVRLRYRGLIRAYQNRRR